MKLQSRMWTICFLALLGAAAGNAWADCPKPITTSSPVVNLPCPSGEGKWGEAFGHWDRRGDTDEVLAAIAGFEAIAKENPDQLEVQLWLARSYHLAGMRHRKESERMAYMDKALAAADRALALDPGNLFATYWRFCSLGIKRDLTAEELGELAGYGAQFREVRELPVPDDDPLWAAAVTHWDARLDRAEGEKAVAVFERLEKKHPGRIEPKLWLCRAHYFMHYHEPDADGMARRTMTAAEWGRKALEIEPRNPAANFFTAASLGQYASNTSFVNVVRYSLEMGSCLLVVTEEDPNYFYGGFSNYFASAIARAGELVEKTADILGFPPAMIERLTLFASHYEPNYLRNHFSLGEMYLAQGRKDEAKKCLETVISSDPAALRLMEPENRMVQKLARELMAKHFP